MCLPTNNYAENVPFEVPFDISDIFQEIRETCGLVEKAGLPLAFRDLGIK